MKFGGTDDISVGMGAFEDETFTQQLEKNHVFASRPVFRSTQISPFCFRTFNLIIERLMLDLS